MKKMNGWLLIGITGVAVFGSHFGIQYFRAVRGRNDIWWTPKSMALPLDKTRQNFEIFLNDETLQDHLARGSLQVTNPEGETRRIVSDDVTARLNNWYKTKASLLHSAIFPAFFLGISVMSLIVGVIRSLTKDKTVFLRA
ncbi:hypothetical protein JW835_05965 [bacterium]|nr:hypothetical protein [bacterium]